MTLTCFLHVLTAMLSTNVSLTLASHVSEKHKTGTVLLLVFVLSIVLKRVGQLHVFPLCFERRTDH